MVKSILTFKDVILYWHIKDQKKTNEKYYIFADGVKVGETDKTHFTMRDVKAKTVNIEIFNDQNKTELFYKEQFTLPEKPRFIDVTKAPYNAVGDGKTVNTKALQAAIDDCGTNECVYIPEGVFVTGALNLHSNMQLYVEKEAEIRGSKNIEDYLPRIWSRFEGVERECYSSLLNLGNISDRDAVACENVLIYGGGKIFGGGKELSEKIIEDERKKLEADPDFEYDMECEKMDTMPGRVRPKLINMSCAKNIVIDNMDVGHGSCWNLHMIYCKDIVTCNSRLFSRDVWNGDGWDPDSSENCTLFNCYFHTGDDCIAIKSGKNPEGNVVNKPCKNIDVFDCRVEYGHSFAVGSEMSGGVSDVYIWDCDFSRTIYGLEIKGTPKRGGYVKDIYMNRCKVPCVVMHSVTYNDDGIAAPEVPYFKDCEFKDITIVGEAIIHKTDNLEPREAIELRGFDDEHMVENISFENITIDNGRESVKQTISLQTLKNVSIKNLSVK